MHRIAPVHPIPSGRGETAKTPRRQVARPDHPKPVLSLRWSGRFQEMRESAQSRVPPPTVWISCRWPEFQ